MAKSTFNDIIDKVQRRADYVVSNGTADDDALFIEIINDNIKTVKQWFLDAQIYDEISASDSFPTVAAQAYVEVSTTTTDLDQPISLREKTNDTTLEFIPVDDFFRLYPAETKDSAATADHVCWWNNRFYFGPTPSQVTTYYLEYIKLIDDLVAGDTMPYEAKYDPLIIAMSVQDVLLWLDPSNGTAISATMAKSKELRKTLIDGAKNIPMNRQTASRSISSPYFNPKMA